LFNEQILSFQAENAQLSEELLALKEAQPESLKLMEELELLSKEREELLD